MILCRQAWHLVSGQAMKNANRRTNFSPFVRMLIAFCFVLWPLNVFAQDANLPRSQSGSPQPSGPANPNETKSDQELQQSLEDKLDRLRFETSRIRSEVQSLDANESNSTARSIQGISRSLSEDVSRTEQIQKQIRNRLFQVRKNMRSKEESQQSKTGTKIESDSTSAATTDSDLMNKDPLKKKKPGIVLPPLKKVKPIDKLGLANNLLVINEPKLAEQILRELQQDSSSGKLMNWIDYQLACSLRQQGQLDKSKALYRELLVTSGDKRINELARWWINYLDRRSKINSTILGIEDQLETYKEEFNESNSN